MDADNAGIEAQVGGGRRASGLYLAHLVDCALHGAAPEVLPEGASWEEVHALAARNGMEGASWRAAALAGDVPSELRRRWAAEADMTLLRLLRFDAEREQVLSAMAARGLSYLPLKGVLIAGYYPAPEMRSMADNDILYGFVEPDEGGGFRISGADEAERGRATALAVREAAALMAERGYEAVSLGKGNHERASARSPASTSSCIDASLRRPARTRPTTPIPGSGRCATGPTLTFSASRMRTSTCTSRACPQALRLRRVRHPLRGGFSRPAGCKGGSYGLGLRAKRAQGTWSGRLRGLLALARGRRVRRSLQHGRA
ncbi:MAG: nucleotidyltransferase family protein [Gordonibacter pamelaeae]